MLVAIKIRLYFCIVKTKNKETMRTANNNFTVEALVAKYRNFVENHAAYDIVGEDDFGLGSYEYGLDGWADHQLLIKLYNDVAGEKADPSIQDRLSKYEEHFWNDILAPEEYAFLIENFKDTVEFIFSKGIHYGSEATSNTVHLMKSDISFIKKAFRYVTVKPEDSVYLENDTLGDGAILFPQCVILCDDKDSDDSALKKIRLFAAGIQYRDINSIEEETIDIIISGSGWFPGFLVPSETLYAALANRGTMVMQAHPHFMASMEEEAVSFRKRLVADKAIKSIIKYSEGSSIFRYVMVIEKMEHSEVDVQDRVRQESGKVDYEQISPRILLPGYYLTEKPEDGMSLSELIDNYDFLHKNQSVSLEQPIVFPQNLGTAFKDADISQKDIKKGIEYGENADNPASNCYNVDFPSVLLYGGTKNTYVGINPQCQVPYAVLDPIACFRAKEGVDLRYVAALLFNPIVAKQISAIYLDFYYGNMMALMPEFLHSIIVPRHDNNERDKYLANTCYDALSSSQKEFKQENDFYRKAVRMRKHALTQSLTSIEAMFYALNAYRIKQNGELHDEDNISRSQRKTVREAFEFISQGLKDMLPALDHIASVEYSFGKSEWIDPEKFIEEYIKKNEKGWLNFKSVITWEQGHNQAVEDLKDPSTGDVIIRKGDSLDMFLFPKEALERVFKNIISNAKAHGFVDKSRNDYQLRFSWHVDGMALIVEIDNNGSAIPNDRDTASLLEYGVSTNLHNDGHNGIGCNEIDDIMQRYDGKVEILSLPEKDFPVKYILTFNRSNTVRSFKI